MNSDNESDLDNAIEGILEDLDSSSFKPAIKTPLFHNTAEDLTKRKETNATETMAKPAMNQAKSVRFQDGGNVNMHNMQQNSEEESIFSKLAPSNMLKNSFFSFDETVEKTPDLKEETKNTTSKPPISGNNNNTRTGISSKATNEEWLGIGKNKQVDSNSKTSAAASQSKQHSMDMFMTSNYDFGLPFDNEEQSSKPKVVDTSAGNAAKPKPPPETMFQQKKTQQGGQTSLLDTVFQTSKPHPPTSTTNMGPQSQARPDDSSPPPSSLDLQNISHKPKQPPPAAATSLIDALPFLLGKQQSSRGETISPTNNEGGGGTGREIIGTNSPSNVQTTRTVKKKLKSSTTSSASDNGGGGGGGVTLQLPSHLVNEDELKAMSSSLKTLYANQLQLLEQSYKEQLDFFASQSKRKEELLKDDLIRMQEDYEQRINKLKADAENGQFPQSLNQELTKISLNLEKVTSQLESNKSHSTDDNPTTEQFAQIVRKEIEAPVLKALSLLETNLTTKLNDNNNVAGKEEAAITSKLDEISKNNQRSAEHILNGQSQLRTVLVDSVLGSVTKAMEHTRVEESRKKGKANQQFKELRKDLRRMVSELDGKSDLIHRSHLNVELEQRSITQSVRDINTFLKVLNESGSLRNTRNKNDSSSAQQFATSVQASVQNEMEIKLLGEERRALSESIAEVNVQRRKLMEEKLGLEREKMDLERERGRVREVEMVSNSRLAEAEDLRRKAEQIRQQEGKLMADAESKRNNLSKEKMKLKERLFELDQAMALKEQKLFLEKSELIREKEFLEKMRQQSLCTGCLKGRAIMPGGNNDNNMQSSSSLHGNLHNLYPRGRSSGDGGSSAGPLDYGPATQIATKISQILTSNEKAYFLQKDNTYLEELMKRVHNS